MSLSSVIISEEVWLTCTTHALTTASEEIMGLLFGDVKYLKGGKTALIWGVSPQIRSDRRKDRVETNPEQLSAAIAEADRMTLTTGNKTRVIGWYHSHPGHTVIPSNVGKQKMQVLSIVPNNADSLQNATLDIDSMDTLEGLQEALHRSTMDMSGGIWVRKVVPLQVLPTKDLLKLDNPLDSLLDMQNMLFEEERLAFKNAIAKNSCDGKIDPITYIHHASTYQASLCNMMEYCLGPAINALEDNLKENEVRLAKLVEEGKALELELTRKEMKSLTVHGQPSRVISSGNQVGVHDLADSVRSP